MKSLSRNSLRFFCFLCFLLLATSLGYRLCGTALIETLTLACQRKAQFIDKTKPSQELLDIQPVFDSQERLVRSKRGVMHECCVNVCRMEDLMGYCNFN